MTLVKWEKRETVAVLTMDNGENRQNLVFAEEMLGTLADILEDDSVRALVITSSDPKNFSQGVDVNWLMERHQKGELDTMKAFMFKMNEVFGTLLTYPLPIIAAINGHAYGNGAMLACACDFRFMRSDRGFFCFPEVNIGIPFLPGMIAWVRKAIPEDLFEEMQLTGERQTADRLEKHRVIRKACENQDQLIDEALSFAATFDKKRGIFGEMKRRMHAGILEIMERDDKPLIDALKIFIPN